MILDRATLLEAELRDSLRSGRLFGEYDEPLDDYGKRVVRRILRALAAEQPEIIESSTSKGRKDASHEKPGARAAAIKNAPLQEKKAGTASITALPLTPTDSLVSRGLPDNPAARASPWPSDIQMCPGDSRRVDEGIALLERELATVQALHAATVAQNDELRRIIAELEAALAATQADKMQWVDEATKAHDALVSAQRCCKKDAGGARQ